MMRNHVQDLKLGLAYFTGRDKARVGPFTELRGQCWPLFFGSLEALRPVLVFRAARIPAAWWWPQLSFSLLGVPHVVLRTKRSS